MQNPFNFESEGLGYESEFDEMPGFAQGEYGESEYTETEFDESEGEQYDIRVRDHRRGGGSPPRQSFRSAVGIAKRPPGGVYSPGQAVQTGRLGAGRNYERAWQRNVPRSYVRPMRVVRGPHWSPRHLTPNYVWKRPLPPHWRPPQPWRYPQGWRFPRGWRPPHYWPYGRGRRYPWGLPYPGAPGTTPSTSGAGDVSDSGAGSVPPPPETGGELVRLLQRLLNRLMNLNLPVDGVMNVETKNAVQAFQNQPPAAVEPTGGPPPGSAPAGAPGENAPAAGGADQPQGEYGFEGEYSDYEYGASPFSFEASAPSPSAVNLASTPCPLHSPSQTTARCRTPQQCPSIPNLLCVTSVNNVPFEYVAGEGMIRRNPQSGLYQVVKRLPNRKQKFIPAVGQALARFLDRMNRFGMPVEAILTAGSLYCRCMTGTNRLSNHSFGDAIDVVGIRWRSQNGSRETLVHNYQNPAERAILRRINACLRLSFPTVIDYHRPRHHDHFHCDMNRGRGRILRGAATVVFVQEALNKLSGQQLRITGKLDRPTLQALSALSGRNASELARPDVLGQVFDGLFERIAAS